MSCDDCGFPYSLCQCPGVNLPTQKDQQMKLLTMMPPLAGTLGKVEVEIAAAIILYVLYISGREWTSSVTEKDLVQTLDKYGGSVPLRWWVTNPFLRPSFAALIESGWAVKEETPDGHVLTLTPAALERVASHLESAFGAPT